MNNEINYQFTPVPTKLFHLCDNNTKSVLFALIQLSSHYAKEDGYFFRTNNDLENDCDLSRKVINAALDALYMRNIIDVIPSAKGQGKKQIGKMFRVNFDAFLQYEELEFHELSNPELKIKTPNTNTNYTPSFNKTLTPTLTPTLTQNANNNYTPSFNKTLTPTLTPTLTQNANNINNIDNINNKNNINNKEINKNNINIKENILENILGESVNYVNNSGYVLLNNLEEENMNIEEAVNVLLSRMESENEKELNEKLILFNNWVNGLNITPTEQEEIEKRIERRYNEIYNKIISSANNGENVDFFSSILVNGSTGKTVKEEKQTDEVIPSKSKEQLLEMMEEVVATSTGREDEAANFKMWVNLNEKEINSYGLMGQAEEVFQLLRKGAKEAVLATISTEVEQVPISKDDTVKTPKNTLKTKLPQMEYNERGEGYVRVGDTTIQVYSDPTEFDFIDEIWSEMQMATAV